MSDYIPPPPTTEYHGKVPRRSVVLEAMRKEILEEARKLHSVIKGRTLGGDVCLDKEEATELLRRLESWAGRV
jgi:hypothetical protein